MIAQDFVSNTIIPIQTSDTGEEVLKMMQVYHVRHLPIVNHEQLLGVISEDDILIHDVNAPIGSYRLSYMRPYALDQDHLFEVMSKLGKFDLTLIPLIDEKEIYLGCITQEDIIRFFAANYSFVEPGGILVLECPRSMYSLSEIARIAESEDTTILASIISVVPDSNLIHITLKLNRQNLNNLKSAFERFGYNIHGIFSEGEYYDDLKDRYDSLMSFLDI